MKRENTYWDYIKEVTMTQLHHQDYINKKLSEISSEKEKLREEYNALEINLRTVGGLIDALNFQERNLKKQKTEFDCSEFLEKLKTARTWTLKPEFSSMLSNQDIKLVKIRFVDYVDRSIGIVVTDSSGHSLNPFCEHDLPFEYFETHLEPYSVELKNE